MWPENATSGSCRVGQEVPHFTAGLVQTTALVLRRGGSADEFPAVVRCTCRRRERTMRKIIVCTFLTLDGVMQAPGGPDEDAESGFEHGGWQKPVDDDEGGA